MIKKLILAAALVFGTASIAEAKCVTASHYGSGKRTANGERFIPSGHTAAHRTLPFGSRVTVTNPRTGRSVNVRINDRGPFIHGRHLDLSTGSARAIGFSGVGKVCLS